MSQVAVIGIGAMGGGMARQLRDSGYDVDAYDKNMERLQDFYKEKKNATKLPKTLSDVIHSTTKAIFLVLLNEQQCESACFETDDVLATSVHIIDGGIGMGSTVKMVHQLLAGVHICVAAEAMALAASAGLDVGQLYNIVNGAAGASWMFQDRGARMMQEDLNEVKSRLDIFVKDLDIVYQEAKRLKAPIPLASMALQQFISGQSLGLGASDDSQVVQVYEKITGTNGANGGAKPGDSVGDLWVFEDGSKELILEVGEEPRHHVVLHNSYVRVIRVSNPPNDTTLAHSVFLSGRGWTGRYKSY